MWTIHAMNSWSDCDGDGQTTETFVGVATDPAVADAYRKAEYKVTAITPLPLPDSPLPRGVSRSF